MALKSLWPTLFTTLPEYKSLLNTFRDFVFITTGETIAINHEDEKYMVDIVETKPSLTILLFKTNCVVDFAPPLDYKEYEKKTTGNLKQKSTCEDGDRITPTVDEDNMKDSKVFPGVGRRLGGTAVHKDDNWLLASDMFRKRLKIAKSSTVVVDANMTKKDLMEFKPFTGAARRVDGQPLVVHDYCGGDTAAS